MFSPSRTSARPERLGASSMKLPYSLTLRTMPRTVSPGAKRLAFSIQVPSNSRWVMVMRRRSRSMERTAAKIFWPSRNRSLG